MSWSTIRRATQEDIDAVKQAAMRFCARHGIELDGMDPETAVGFATSASSHDSYENQARARRLNALWTRIVRRALRDTAAEGIAYGYVGYHVD